MRKFLLIWLGQSVSLLGTTLTGFSLGIWVFEKSNSVISYSLIYFSVITPVIFLGPVIGALIDRYDRRKILILGHGGAGVFSLAIAVLYWTGNLKFFMIIPLVICSAIFNSFVTPAFLATTTLLVAKNHLGRANGMITFISSLAAIAAPPIAAFLIATIKLDGILLIDVSTFLFAIIILLCIKLPRPEKSKDRQEVHPQFSKELLFGLTFIKKHKDLLAILIFYALLNFYAGLGNVLLTPLILSFSTAGSLGTVLSFGGIGGIIGSAVMIIWGGPKKKIYGVLLFSLLISLAYILQGSAASILIISTSTVMIMFSLSISSSCNQVIWQNKVPPDVQGKVFSFSSMITTSTIPLASLAAGPLAEKIFEPLMAKTGYFASSIGQIIGTGKGRGIGLLYITIGIIAAITILIAFLIPKIRRIEEV